jgi:hypothetical protein
MWRSVGLVRIDVSEIRLASILRVESISELGAALTVTSNWSTLRRNTTYMRKAAMDEWRLGYVADIATGSWCWMMLNGLGGTINDETAQGCGIISLSL